MFSKRQEDCACGENVWKINKDITGETYGDK